MTNRNLQSNRYVDNTNVRVHNIDAASLLQQEPQNENVVNPSTVRNDNFGVEMENPNLVLVIINVVFEAQNQLVNQLTPIFDQIGRAHV